MRIERYPRPNTLKYVPLMVNSKTRYHAINNSAVHGKAEKNGDMVPPHIIFRVFRLGRTCTLLRPKNPSKGNVRHIHINIPRQTTTKKAKILPVEGVITFVSNDKAQHKRAKIDRN